MKRKLSELGLVLLCYLLQVTLDRNIAIAGIVPNFLIMITVLFAYIQGKKDGMFVGFFAGLLYDLFFTGLVGFSSLCFVLLGYVNGMFRSQFEENNFIAPMIAISASTFAYEFLIFVGNFVLHNRLIAPFFTARIIIPEIIYTTVIAMAVYKPLCILNRHLDSRKRKVKDLDETIL